MPKCMLRLRAADKYLAGAAVVLAFGFALTNPWEHTLATWAISCLMLTLAVLAVFNLAMAALHRRAAHQAAGGVSEAADAATDGMLGQR